MTNYNDEYLNELCEKYLSLKGKQKLMEDLKEKFRNQLNEKVGDQRIHTKNYLVFKKEIKVRETFIKANEYKRLKVLNYEP